MRKPLFLLLVLAVPALRVRAQTEPYGVVDTAELKLSSCDFEKDANAMVLFDKATVTYKFSSAVVMERHKRIKIFNDKGKSAADFRLEFYGVHKDEDISDLEAETINLDGGKIAYIPVDSKSIFTQIVDKDTKALVFSFPAVKAGSVIEFRYKKTTPYSYNYPDWFFQSNIPTRYSEFDASFLQEYLFSIESRIFQPMAVDTVINTTAPMGSHHIWVMKNIGSYKKEPFMDYPDDYVECILTKNEFSRPSWTRIGDGMLGDEDFGEQLQKNISGQDQIISRANKLSFDKEKIAFLFDTVRNAMKWNKIDRWYCDDGIRRAWDKKTGNSTEINLILYNLLAAANVNCFLLGVRNREDGRLDIYDPSWYSIEKVVVYAQADPSTSYILDASDKLNTYDNTPADLEGLKALKIAATAKVYSFMDLPPGVDRTTTLITGEITPDGKLKATSQVSDIGYDRYTFLKQYFDDGEKKYIDNIEKEHNGLKISSFKLENVQSDTIPLTRTIDFNYNLTEPDGDYMYFNTNLFTGFNENPFLAEKRVSDIDFGSQSIYSINGRYKLPAGYKVDALPQSTSMQMPDKGITFKRIAAEQDGYLIIHYVINFSKTFYPKAEYPSIRDFYKKMLDMLNEQVVLKKG